MRIWLRAWCCKMHFLSEFLPSRTHALHGRSLSRARSPVLLCCPDQRSALFWRIELIVAPQQAVSFVCAAAFACSNGRTISALRREVVRVPLQSSNKIQQKEKKPCVNRKCESSLFVKRSVHRRLANSSAKHTKRKHQKCPNNVKFEYVIPPPLFGWPQLQNEDRICIRFWNFTHVPSEIAPWRVTERHSIHLNMII